MLAVWTFLKGAFSFLVKNWGWIATILMALFIFMTFKQCDRAKRAEARTEEVQLIADNNIKALKDSTIMLKVTREQLGIIDKNLAKVAHELDSLKKHPRTVVVTVPVYIPKDVTTPNTLVRDKDDSTKYGLAFNSVDSVRTIKGTSWFNLFQTDTKLEVKPANTVIHDFNLHFGLAFARYEDEKAKVSRISVEPWFINENGDFVKPISKNLLELKSRGAEVLDVPYVDISKPCPPPKHKYSIRSGFSLNVNLVSYGYTPFAPTPAFNWMMPSLGIGYSFVLVRNK